MDSITNWTENDVSKWLDNIKLGQYKEKFKGFYLLPFINI